MQTETGCVVKEDSFGDGTIVESQVVQKRV